MDAAFARAAHRVEIELVNNRLCGAAIETRGAIATGDTLYCGTQTPHHIRQHVCAELGLRENELRVVSYDMGGGFGYKGKHYPEETIVVWAARRLRRPVKWIATRNESFVSDTQGRDHRTRASLALDRDGRFLALRVQTRADLGAYVSTFGAAIPGPIYSALLAGLYRTPAIHIEVTGVFSNSPPTPIAAPAGRRRATCSSASPTRRRASSASTAPRSGAEPDPEGGHAVQDADRADLRLRRFPRIFERALAVSDYENFEQRRKEAKTRNRLRGIGLACYLESSGVAPSRLAGMMGARGGFYEAATVRVAPDGSVTAYLGTHNHGQGHSTTFAQILADRLGVPIERISVLEGDTAAVPVGTGTFGSRSIAVGGSALHAACEKVIAKGKKIAAHLLEASAADIEFSAGEFRVAARTARLAFGTSRSQRTSRTIIRSSPWSPGWTRRPTTTRRTSLFQRRACLRGRSRSRTGRVELVSYHAVDDIGTVINPMIVEGQLHGGLAQGIGQALAERTVYDAGQLLSASFMDYALPRASDLPRFFSRPTRASRARITRSAPRGAGIGRDRAPAAVMSALLDALQIEHLEMPATPHAVWRAIMRK